MRSFLHLKWPWKRAYFLHFFFFLFFFLFYFKFQGRNGIEFLLFPFLPIFLLRDNSNANSFFLFNFFKKQNKKRTKCLFFSLLFFLISAKRKKKWHKKDGNSTIFFFLFLFLWTKTEEGRLCINAACLEKFESVHTYRKGIFCTKFLILNC